MSPSEGGGIGRRTSGGSHLERMASLVDYSSSDESEGDAWHPNPGDPHHHHTNAGDDRFDGSPVQGRPERAPGVLVAATRDAVPTMMTKQRRQACRPAELAVGRSQMLPKRG